MPSPRGDGTPSAESLGVATDGRCDRGTQREPREGSSDAGIIRRSYPQASIAASQIPRVPWTPACTSSSPTRSPIPRPRRSWPPCATSSARRPCIRESVARSSGCCSHARQPWSPAQHRRRMCRVSMRVRLRIGRALAPKRELDVLDDVPCMRSMLGGVDVDAEVVAEPLDEPR